MKTKQQKRMEAEARNTKWNELTFIDKMFSLAHRPGESKKQMEKLTERYHSETRAIIINH